MMSVYNKWNVSVVIGAAHTCTFVNDLNAVGCCHIDEDNSLWKLPWKPFLNIPSKIAQKKFVQIHQIYHWDFVLFFLLLLKTNISVNLETSISLLTKWLDAAQMSRTCEAYLLSFKRMAFDLYRINKMPMFVKMFWCLH